MNTPEILAPAGDKFSYFAAIAAGADAIYCGLKAFNARMEAGNFSIETLSRLSEMAASRNIRTHIALNSLVKESELDRAYRVLLKLKSYVKFHSLIIQDIGLIPLIKKAGIQQELHLSTLGNCTSVKGLETAKQLGFSKVVVPREFSLDDLRTMAQNTPEGLSLEAFVHGALCYSISGRCYWSSWLGGKSALRGRCVQPCRRIYSQQGTRQNFFSCLDLSADVLAKVLCQIPQIKTWKIEGRKKSPHYVYYTVKAYKILRDHPSEKKQAIEYLDYALGRKGSHYALLGHRPSNPLLHNGETASGLFTGRIQNPTKPEFITREPLLQGDLLRIGYEDDSFHTIEKVTRAIPKKGRYFLKRQKHRIKKGTPVHIIDRRGTELSPEIDALEAQFNEMPKPPVRPQKKAGLENASNFQATARRKNTPVFVHLSRDTKQRKSGFVSKKDEQAVWLSQNNFKARYSKDDWIFLDPLIFPDEEKKVANALSKALQKGVRKFIVNAVWQLGLFKNLKNVHLWAGPYCNIANCEHIKILKKIGFSGCFVSPELDQKTILSLSKSTTLPLGIVLQGNWPLGISRICSDQLKPGKAILSPKNEIFWLAKHQDNFYIYPNWILDLTEHKNLLINAGFTVFLNIHEHIPKGISLKSRPGLWNWNLKLL